MGFLGIGGSSQTTTTRIDPGAERFREYMFGRARAMQHHGYQNFAGQRIAGLDPSTIAGYESLMAGDPNAQAGLTGLLGGLQGMGGPLNIGEFMNPYLSEVVGAAQGDFDRMRAASLQSVGGDAISRGAFGGSRHGIAEGTALGEVARAEGSTLASLRHGGYESAVQAALANRAQRAGFGLSAAGMLSDLHARRAGAQIGLGEAQRGIAQSRADFQFGEHMRRMEQPYRNFSLLTGAMGAAPYGQSQTTESSGNLLSTLGGIASFGASFIPGVGGAVNAAKGLLGGGGQNYTPHVVPISRGTGMTNWFGSAGFQRPTMPTYP